MIKSDFNIEMPKMRYENTDRCDSRDMTIVFILFLAVAMIGMVLGFKIILT